MIREVEKVQWIEPRCDGHWTHLHKAFDYARRLLEQWMEHHHEHDCYLPTILHRRYVIKKLFLSDYNLTRHLARLYKDGLITLDDYSFVGVDYANN